MTSRTEIVFLGEKNNPFVFPEVAAKRILGIDNPTMPGAYKGGVKRYFEEVSSDFSKGLDKSLDLCRRGEILDVGIADEGRIILGALGNIGIQFSVLSIQRYPERYPPRTTERPIWYDGDIALAAEATSDLANKKFGTILFWGSWDTEGAWTVDNAMIGNTVKKRLEKQDPKTPQTVITQKVSEEKDAILGACRKILSRNGLIGIVSARYSFLGGGFNYHSFDHEMISHLDVVRRGADLGANKIHIFGRTREEFRVELLDESAKTPDYLGALKKQIDKLSARMNLPLSFPSTIDNSFLTPEDTAQANALWERSPSRTTIGFIDAVFIEF